VTGRGDDLLDETTLRRALRLEADERSPLFDAATIAAAARQRPRLAIVSALVALALGVVGAVTVWSAVVIFVPTVVANVFDAGLTIFALLAVPATGTLELAQQPAVPLSLLVALAIASAHELRERRQTVASAR
jgi:hypothetical protein